MAFLKLIQESRPLLQTATPQQKVKLLRLIKENYRLLKQESQSLPLLLVEENADYLSEK